MGGGGWEGREGEGGLINGRKGAFKWNFMMVGLFTTALTPDGRIGRAVNKLHGPGIFTCYYMYLSSGYVDGKTKHGQHQKPIFSSATFFTSSPN